MLCPRRKSSRDRYSDACSNGCQYRASRGHIVKQDAIIARLTEQGHGELADEARSLLATIYEHLAFEIEMLKGMQSRPKG